MNFPARKHRNWIIGKIAPKNAHVLSIVFDLQALLIISHPICLPFCSVHVCLGNLICISTYNRIPCELKGIYPTSSISISPVYAPLSQFVHVYIFSSSFWNVTRTWIQTA